MAHEAAPSRVLRCPRCEATDLDQRMREGVSIDVCPGCRGVWLDRGELEKLAERLARRAREDDDDDEDDDHDDDDDDRGFGARRDDGRSGPRRQGQSGWRGLLGGLLD